MKTSMSAFLLVVLISTLPACILKRDPDASSSSDSTGGGGPTSTPKLLTKSDWVNTNGAYTIDMHNAVTDGTHFNAHRTVGGYSCDCDMTMTGTTASGTYTSTCTLATGSGDCTIFNPGTLANGASGQCANGSSTVAPYSMNGTNLRFGSCGPTNFNGIIFQ